MGSATSYHANYRSLDSNYNYFKKGLSEIQARLELREYVTVSSFATDFGHVLNEVVFAPEAEEELPLRPSEVLNEVSSKPKDLRKEKTTRAKRIIKLLLPDFQEAAKKLADLGHHAPDDEKRQVEDILETCLQQPSKLNRVHGGQVGESEDETGLTANAGDKSEDTEMVDADAAPERAVSEQKSAIVLQITSEDGTHLAKRHSDSPGAAGTVPDLSNSGSTNAGSTNHGPLTPPTSEKEMTGPLANGGIPWYMSPFDPIGTTIHDDQWSGQDDRGISEELSELDDDIVNGLVDDQVAQKLAGGIARSEQMLAVPTSTTKKRPKPKSRRR
jgi:NuA3 HAT complex component NTO1